jgi:hypothetical protein
VNLRGNRENKVCWKVEVKSGEVKKNRGVKLILLKSLYAELSLILLTSLCIDFDARRASSLPLKVTYHVRLICCIMFI